MERRGGRRFNLQAPVQFTWRLPGSGVASEDGRTRDISVRGVFVLASTCPPEGSVLRMRVSLPACPGDSSLEMQADATVVRVEGSGSEDCPGFAAITKRCSLSSWRERAQKCEFDLESVNGKVPSRKNRQRQRFV